VTTSRESERVYLIDASIYIFRGWFVWPDTLTGTDGWPVNAVHGFAHTLIELLERERPTHLAGAFDESLGQCARREIYPEYKANRPPAPEELKRQFGRCRALLRACGIAEFASGRFEADDIIGTLAKLAREQGLPATIVSADKDLAQLIGDNDIWWDFARDRKLDARGVEKHFGAPASSVADMLALAGDKVDNIPGVPGIGMGIAAKLMRRFGSIDRLYDEFELVAKMQIRGAKRVQSLLDEHRDTIALARQLTHCLHVDGLPTSCDHLRPQQADFVALDELLDEIRLPAQQRERLVAAL
jgi:5'-3' exonuclease